MKSFRQSLAAVLVASLSVAAGLFGFQVIQNAQFARAEQKVEATREQLATVNDLASVFRQVARTVEPSVVNINVKKTIKNPHRMNPDDMLRRFFPDRNGDGVPDAPDTQTPEDQQDDGTLEQIGTGSGVVIETKGNIGYVVTNNHVVGKASEIEITLNDGRVIKNGKVLGTDAKTDLAVVQITADRLIPVRWGESNDLQVGDWVLAFGSPFGYVGSMTHGIVSALNRTNVGILGNQGYEDFIQVDAPINPGNSGGPLVNIRGEVIGINTAIASRTGGFQGIGFAIPSHLAQQIYTSLKDKGRVTRGWLGVSISDVAKNLPTAKSFGFEGTQGVLVEQTFPNTPAYGKLEPGDIVTTINGKPINDVQQLRNTVAATPPGSDIKLQVFRARKNTEVTLKVGEQPEDVLAAARGGGAPAPGEKGDQATTATALGMKLATLNDQLAERFNLEDIKSGAVVTSVTRNSLAATAGVRPGDVITRVGETPVTSALDARDALAKADIKAGIRLYITSREGSRFVFLQQQ